MSALLGTSVNVVSEESRSVLASIIVQLTTIVRTAIDYALSIVKKFVEWSGEHPLAMLLLMANVIIWIS